MDTLVLMSDDGLRILTNAEWIADGHAAFAIRFEDDFLLVILALALLSDHYIIEGEYGYAVGEIVTDWSEPQVAHIFGRETVAEFEKLAADLPVAIPRQGGFDPRMPAGGPDTGYVPSPQTDWLYEI